MWWVAYVTTVVLLGWIMSAGAFAHDDVIATSPSNGGQVVEVPEDVRVEFAEPPASGSGSIIGPAGREFGGKPVVTGTELVIPMRSGAAPGNYRVEFRGRSTDGHRLSGTMTFEVISPPTSGSAQEGSLPEPATNAGAPADAESPAARRGGFPAWLPVGLVGIGVVAVGILLSRHDRTGRSGIYRRGVSVDPVDGRPGRLWK